MAVNRTLPDALETASPVVIEAGDRPVALPSAEILVEGDYRRLGGDLAITGPGGERFLILGYFDRPSPPALAAPDGVSLDPDLVAKLAGPLAPGQLAQAGTSPGQPIGEIVKLEGDARITRASGEVVAAEIGDPVFANDVVETGEAANIGISLLDETVLTVNAGSRMVLDELVYDPASASGSMLLSLVSGSFAFISGEIAPNGDMVLRTPVTTLGIRGTAGAATYDGTTTQMFTFVDPRTGEVSRIEIYDLSGNLLGVLTTDDTFAAYNGATGVFIQTFLSAEQEQFADEIYQLLEDAAVAAGIDVTQSIDEGNRRVTRLAGDQQLGEAEGEGAGGGDGITPVGDGAADEGAVPGGPAGGVNHPPIGAAINAGPTNEDVPAFSFNLLQGWSDPEGAPLNVSNVSVQASDGRPVLFVLNGSTFGVPAAASPTFDQFGDLALGETVAITVSYDITDGIHTVANTAHFLVEGRNDTPVVSPGDEQDPVDLEEEADTTGSTIDRVTAEHTIIFHDDDLSDIGDTAEVKSVVVTVDPPSVTSGLAAALIREGASGDTLDALLLDAEFMVTPPPVRKDAGVNEGQVDWEFDAPDQVFDYLAEGETVTFTYTIELDDEEGVDDPPEPDEGEVSETIKLLDVVITVTGTNDRPVITSGDVVGEVTEDISANGADRLIDSGTLAFTDVDLSDGHTAAASFSSAVWSGDPTLPAGLKAKLEVAFSAAISTGDPSAGDGAGTIDWTFDLDNVDAQFLSQGETLTVTYNVAVTDDSSVGNNDTSATKQIVVTITGTNDRPVITSEPFEEGLHEVAGVTDGEAVLSTGGTITFADVDATDTHTVNATAPAVIWSGGTLGPAQQAAFAAALLVGSDGTWSFYIPDADVDFLAAGETIEVTTQVTVTDDSAAANATSAAQILTVTITGTNDAPTVTAITDTVGEDSPPIQFDLLTANAADVDSTDVLSVQNVDPSVVVDGRTLVLGTDYTVVDSMFELTAAGLAKFNNLSDGESDDIVIGYEVFDGTAAVANTVTLTVNGADEMITHTLTQGDLTLDEPVGDVDLTVDNDTGGPAMITVSPLQGPPNGIQIASSFAGDGISTVTIEDVVDLDEIVINLGDSGDTLNFVGDFSTVGVEPAAVTVNGGAGDDMISGAGLVDNGQGGGPVLALGGGGGADELVGTPGEDVLIGGAGDDTLAGGPGGGTGDGDADTFVLEQNGGFDTILDFETAFDLLDLTDLLTGVTADNIDEYVRVQSDNPNNQSIVQVDNDGSAGPADFTNVAALDGVGGGDTISVVFDDQGSTAQVAVA